MPGIAARADPYRPAKRRPESNPEPAPAAAPSELSSISPWSSRFFPSDSGARKATSSTAANPAFLSDSNRRLENISIVTNAIYDFVFSHDVLLDNFSYWFFSDLTVSSFFTFEAPAISVALASTASFSDCERTGPFSSTTPSRVIILTVVRVGGQGFILR